MISSAGLGVQTLTIDGSKSPANISGVSNSFSGLNSERPSKWCGVWRARDMALSSDSSVFAKSVMVSMQPKQFGRYKFHPIGYFSGIPINSGLFCHDGNRTTRQCVSFGQRNKRWKPLDRLILDITTGPKKLFV